MEWKFSRTKRTWKLKAPASGLNNAPVAVRYGLNGASVEFRRATEPIGITSPGLDLWPMSFLRFSEDWERSGCIYHPH